MFNVCGFDHIVLLGSDGVALAGGYLLLDRLTFDVVRDEPIFWMLTDEHDETQAMRDNDIEAHPALPLTILIPLMRTRSPTAIQEQMSAFTGADDLAAFAKLDLQELD